MIFQPMTAVNLREAAICLAPSIYSFSIENPDIVYRTEKEKYFAAADEIQQLAGKGQPVLVNKSTERPIGRAFWSAASMSRCAINRDATANTR